MAITDSHGLPVAELVEDLELQSVSLETSLPGRERLTMQSHLTKL